MYGSGVKTHSKFVTLMFNCYHLVFLDAPSFSFFHFPFVTTILHKENSISSTNLFQNYVT